MAKNKFRCPLSCLVCSMAHLVFKSGWFWIVFGMIVPKNQDDRRCAE